MSLRVYNTLTRQKELFEPVVPGKVGMYLCGPTVYKPSHIGHAVGPIIFDAIKRYLVHKGYQVRWIVNITDIDDKIIAEARRQGRTMREIALEVEANYKTALAGLNVTGVDKFPRASEYVGEIIALVARLLEKHAAYVADGDVYFDHLATSGYGRLSGRRAEDQLAGSRELTGQNKRHPADFALWKAAKPDEPSWDSPWGKGRPGWHIECSAMSLKLLGETFDIHGGGMELIFPHHENELAQSETATGKPFVKYWLHNGLTRGADKQKMSKSLGNIRVLSELLAAYPGEVIRAFVLSTHYRRPLDFSEGQLDNTARALETFYRLFERIARATGADSYAGGPTIDKIHEAAQTPADAEFVKTVLRGKLAFHEAMDDDFNTANALAALHAMAGTINRYMDSSGSTGVSPVSGTGISSRGTGILPVRPTGILPVADAAGRSSDTTAAPKEETHGLQASRATQESPASPAAALAASAGATLVQTARILGLFDRPPASVVPSGIDPARIEQLIAARAAARQAKDFKQADQIRRQLAEMGITLEDTPGGTVWRKT